MVDLFKWGYYEPQLIKYDIWENLHYDVGAASDGMRGPLSFTTGPFHIKLPRVKGEGCFKLYTIVLYDTKSSKIVIIAVEVTLYK